MNGGEIFFLMSEDRNYTSIQVSKETRDQLKELGLTPNESYENILKRLLEGKTSGKEVEYILQDVNADCNVKAVVDWGASTENQCVKYYDKDGNCVERVPQYIFDDKDFQVKWDEFLRDVEGLDNLINILSILESGDSIRAGNLILSRV